MAITKRDNGTYLLSFRPDGVRGRYIRKIFYTKREALAYQKQVLSGKIIQKHNYRLNELIDIWYKNHGVSLKSSRDTKARMLKVSSILLNPIVTDSLNKLFVSYRTTRLESGIKPGTLNRELTMFRAMFKELNNIGVIDLNPFKNVRKLKDRNLELTYLDWHQIQDLLNELEVSKNSSVYLVTEICLHTGCRWSEAEKLQRDHLKNGLIQFVDTKNGFNRFVPVSDFFYKKIVSFLEENNRFDSCYSAFRSGLARTGIKTMDGQCAHLLRHTFASHFMINGGNILALQKILGHSSLNVTMRYAHLSKDFLNEAVHLNPLNF